MPRNYKYQGYYVYAHVNIINDKIYIGITRQHLTDRFGTQGQGYTHKRNTHFSNAIKKYGWNNFEHIILAQGLTKEEACQMEKSLIEFYDTMNNKYGYNHTSGGDTNLFLSDETKRKIGLDSKAKWQRIPHPMLGRKHSEESKMKMSLNKSKPVFVYDKKGNFIAEFYGATKAARELNLKATNVVAVCHKDNPKFRTAGGYIFRYQEDMNFDKTKTLTDKEIRFATNRDNEIGVFQYDLSGNKINYFYSISQAERFLNVNIGDNRIHKAIANERYYTTNYIWLPETKFKGEDILPIDFLISIAKHFKNELPIIQCDVNGNEIKIFANAKEVKEWCLESGFKSGWNVVRDCLSNKRKVGLGFVWKRKDINKMV